MPQSKRAGTQICRIRIFYSETSPEIPTQIRTVLTAPSATAPAVAPPPAQEPPQTIVDSHSDIPRNVGITEGGGVVSESGRGAGAQANAPAPAVPLPPPQTLLTKLRAALSFRTRKRLEKIMQLALSRVEGGATRKSIVNDDVEKLLRVSDATATNYLRELVRQGRLRRVGTTSGSRYEAVR